MAAKLYELKKLEGYQFQRTQKTEEGSEGDQEFDTPNDFEVEIVNHMFIKNMDIVRKNNPCLSQYQLECTDRGTNEYSYIKKSKFEDS